MKVHQANTEQVLVNYKLSTRQIYFNLNETIFSSMSYACIEKHGHQFISKMMILSFFQTKPSFPFNVVFVNIFTFKYLNKNNKQE
jgi:hypothetical protein